MVYKNNDLVGIAPFYLKNDKYGPFKMRQIEFLGTPEAGSDYLDVITFIVGHDPSSGYAVQFSFFITI
jgi:hypothetical protein